VRRGGEIVSINEENLLVGDILMVYSGDHIPADGIIIQEYTGLKLYIKFINLQFKSYFIYKKFQRSMNHL
jgi:magnesium-transporting ATPase (P-type)